MMEGGSREDHLAGDLQGMRSGRPGWGTFVIGGHGKKWTKKSNKKTLILSSSVWGNAAVSGAKM